MSKKQITKKRAGEENKEPEAPVQQAIEISKLVFVPSPTTAVKGFDYVSLIRLFKICRLFCFFFQECSTICRTCEIIPYHYKERPNVISGQIFDTPSIWRDVEVYRDLSHA